MDMGHLQGVPGMLPRMRSLPHNASFRPACLLIEMKVSWGSGDVLLHQERQLGAWHKKGPGL